MNNFYFLRRTLRSLRHNKSLSVSNIYYTYVLRHMALLPSFRSYQRCPVNSWGLFLGLTYFPSQPCTQQPLLLTSSVICFWDFIDSFLEQTITYFKTSLTKTQLCNGAKGPGKPTQTFLCRLESLLVLCTD